MISLNEELNFKFNFNYFKFKKSPVAIGYHIEQHNSKGYKIITIWTFSIPVFFSALPSIICIFKLIG